MQELGISNKESDDETIKAPDKAWHQKWQGVLQKSKSSFGNQNRFKEEEETRDRNRPAPARTLKEEPLEPASKGP